MTKSIALMTLLCAPLLGGCFQTVPASSPCDGWEKMTPSGATANFIIKNDRPFAVQVGSHNAFGVKKMCW